MTRQATTVTNSRNITGRQNNAWVNADPDASVLLPTFQRPDILARVLQAYDKQDAAADAFELIVIDDGSADTTPQVLKDHAEGTTRPFRFVSLERNSGPAVARNTAIDLLRAPVTVIAGDDIVPPANFVAQHLEWHASHPKQSDALLGAIRWDAGVDRTPFMQWLETSGSIWFMDYPALTPGKQVDAARYFYTANVSVKTTLLRNSGGFNESFRFASGEDLELGFRLARMGMRLFYEPSVTALHCHSLDTQSLVRRIYLMGYSAHQYWELTAAGSPTRRTLRKLLSRAAASAPGLTVWKRLQHRILSDGRDHSLGWSLLAHISFSIGVHDAARHREPRNLSSSRAAHLGPP